MQKPFGFSPVPPKRGPPEIRPFTRLISPPSNYTIEEGKKRGAKWGFEALCCKNCCSLDLFTRFVAATSSPCLFVSARLKSRQRLVLPGSACPSVAPSLLLSGFGLVLLGSASGFFRDYAFNVSPLDLQLSWLLLLLGLLFVLGPDYNDYRAFLFFHL
ncbi:hypothetical protein TNCT_627941 [Trichonephila clavata]|uniref:Uncharacterized protein n=1 Tax=Trichonephila clavata TaxID=2740835 RepID=A0A8X6L683_TRICU|nr:hypothetical protein TNCT_627941 [Trichonephila clavata]